MSTITCDASSVKDVYGSASLDLTQLFLNWYTFTNLASWPKLRGIDISLFEMHVFLYLLLVSYGLKFTYRLWVLLWTTKYDRNFEAWELGR